MEKPKQTFWKKIGRIAPVNVQMMKSMSHWEPGSIELKNSPTVRMNCGLSCEVWSLIKETNHWKKKTSEEKAVWQYHNQQQAENNRSPWDVKENAVVSHTMQGVERWKSHNTIYDLAKNICVASASTKTQRVWLVSK